MLGKPTLKPDLERAAHRVLRGGSWGLSAVNARAAVRYWYYPGFRYDFLGLRLARDIHHEGEHHEKEE
jgi:formylglycine-generating enzyme required for sulfatase activity